MLTGYNEFKKYSDNKKIRMINKMLDPIVQNFDFLQIDKVEDLKPEMYPKIEKTKVFSLDLYSDELYNIVCLEGYLLIIDKNKKEILEKIISIIPYFQMRAYTLEEYPLQRNKDCSNKYQIEVEQMVKSFQICYIYEKSIINFWSKVKESIAGFLIQKAYSNCQINRFHKSFYSQQSLLKENKSIKIFENKEFITLRSIDTSSSSSIFLAYHIESGELVSIKKITNVNADELNTQKREIENYSNIRHPLIPKFYGIIQDKQNADQTPIVIEYIHGTTLRNISNLNLCLEIKMNIILELLFVFNYLHKSRYIYRDLKPNNVMIDHNFNIVLIDFDRMIHKNQIDQRDCSDFTRVFTIFSYPKINDINYKPSYECDIYSIGNMIQFILTEQNPTSFNENNFENQFPFIYNNVYKKCINNDNIRVSDLIEYFKNIQESQKNEIEFSDLFIKKIQQTIKSYEEFESNVLDLAHFIFNLGLIYYEGIKIQQDMHKAIYYFSLSAKYNYPDAFYHLGLLYLEGNNVDKNINKAIKYFSRASKFNHGLAQYKLGIIYYEGISIQKDIPKGIDYFIQSANNNCDFAQYFLGYIYSDPYNSFYDKNKAINYLTLAANNNFTLAQNDLGIIYRDGTFCGRDIRKSIHYFSLAAKKKFVESLYNLGVIFLEGKLIEQDVEKAIDFFSQAARENHPSSMYNLGCIYGGEVIMYQNMNKAIYYLTKAADFDHPLAQSCLGCFYFRGDGVKKDIDKGIKYLTLAAQNNDKYSQLKLGYIYYKIPTLKDINKSIYYFSKVIDGEKSSYLHYQIDFNVENHIFYQSTQTPIINYRNRYINDNELTALYFLGIIFLKENFPGNDKNKGVEYLKRAAKKNHIQSQIVLSKIYMDGYIFPKDQSLSFYYVKMAEKQNDPEAQHLLGVYYLENYIDSIDISKIIELFEQSANQKYSDAWFSLGKLYYYGIRVKSDINKAVNYFKKGAELKNSNALLYLGAIYYNGENGERDVEKGIEYFKLSSKFNNIDAEFWLGHIYLFSQFIPRNINKGLEIMNKCSNLEHRKAQAILGDLYLEGKYVKRDIDKSITYYKKVSNVNNFRAKNNLAVLNKMGFGQKSIPLAEEYLKEAIAIKKDPIVLYNLALINYEKEMKSKSDNQQSIGLLSESLNQGFIPSSELLGVILFLKHKTLNLEIIRKEMGNFCTKNAIFVLFGFFFNLMKKIIFERRINIDEIINNYLETYFVFLGEDAFLFHNVINNKISEKNSSNEESNPRNKAKDINLEFYQGIGNDIISDLQI